MECVRAKKWNLETPMLQRHRKKVPISLNVNNASKLSHIYIYISIIYLLYICYISIIYITII